MQYSHLFWQERFSFSKIILRKAKQNTLKKLVRAYYKTKGNQTGAGVID